MLNSSDWLLKSQVSHYHLVPAVDLNAFISIDIFMPTLLLAAFLLTVRNYTKCGMEK